MFSLEVAVSIPLLYCIAYTYDIFLSGFLYQCKQTGIYSVFTAHKPGKTFFVSSKTLWKNTTDEDGKKKILKRSQTTKITIWKSHVDEIHLKK